MPLSCCITTTATATLLVIPPSRRKHRGVWQGGGDGGTRMVRNTNDRDGSLGDPSSGKVPHIDVTTLTLHELVGHPAVVLNGNLYVVRERGRDGDVIVAALSLYGNES